MKKYIFLSLVLLLGAGCGAQTTPTLDTYSYSTSEQPRVAQEPVTPPSFPTIKENEKTPMTTSTPELQKQVIYVATLHTTEGDIEITLNSGETPNTVNNFVSLSKKDFYDNTIFHRVISGFMIQGGDPDGDGTGGPGYTFDDEPFTGEYTRGAVAMANRGPDTNGSQFFIMHADYPLPKNYTIFGRVTKGMDVVDKIATAPVKSGGRENSTPVNPVKVLSVDIAEK